MTQQQQQQQQQGDRVLLRNRRIICHLIVYFRYVGGARDREHGVGSYSRGQS